MDARILSNARNLSTKTILILWPLAMASKRKFSSKITFNNNDIDRGVQLLSDKAIAVLEIPQEILIYWHSLKDKGQDLAYANSINSFAVLPFKVLQNPSLEKRIADVAGLARRECHGKSGRKRQELWKKKRSVKICKADICHEEAAVQHNDGVVQNRVESLAIEELEKRCSELFSQLTAAKQTLTNVDTRLNRCEAEKSLLKEANATLANQIEQIEHLNVCRNCAPNLENHSKELNEVGIRQRQRKIKELSTKAEKALWFLESYGVTLDSLSVEDSNGGRVDLLANPEGNRKSKYEALPENQKTKIKEVLHIVDRFCVGDACYHALSTLEGGLPRSYLIKQCRGAINSCFVITRTPGDLIGAQMSFVEELRRKIKEKVGMCITM